MNTRLSIYALAGLALLFCAGGNRPVWALSIEPDDAVTRTIRDSISKYVDVPEGAVSWQVFGTTREIDVEGKTPDGLDFGYTKPGFQPKVTALDGQQIRIKGYMFPLDETEQQKSFLFGPFPLSCPFHYHVGPSLVMEVHADQHPVAFSYDPVVLTGRLQLVPDDPDYSTFYRLLDARVVK